MSNGHSVGLGRGVGGMGGGTVQCTSKLHVTFSTNGLMIHELCHYLSEKEQLPYHTGLSRPLLATCEKEKTSIMQARGGLRPPILQQSRY